MDGAPVQMAGNGAKKVGGYRMELRDIAAKTTFVSRPVGVATRIGTNGRSVQLITGFDSR